MTAWRSPAERTRLLLEAEIVRALQLVAAEVSLRETARRVELIPARRAYAKRLFDRASELREQRLELLTRCGLV